MIDHDVAQLALQNRVQSLIIATTGSTSLAATTTGYTRASGSFLDDGFRPGMEIVAAGFTANGYRVIKEVAAGEVKTDETLTAEVAAGSRSLVAGAPEIRFWDNERPVQSGSTIETALAGRPYIEEEYAPSTQELFGGPKVGGEVIENGLYVIRWYGIAGRGAFGLRRSVQKLLALFTPHTTIAAGNYTVRVRGDIAPWAGPIRPLDNGWVVCTVTIPWTVYSNNAIAA